MKSILILAVFGIIGAQGAEENTAREPGKVEQAKVLADATRYVLNHQMPDFSCLQTTHRLENPDDARWSAVETVVERLTYFDRRESYQLLEINGRPPSNADQHLEGARSPAEFASIMRAIFLPQTKTEFVRQGWVTMRGQNMHAYSYYVPPFRSQYHFELPEASLDLTTAYHGMVFIDNRNHFVHRITLLADGIPASAPIRDVSFTLDYEYARIGRTDYMLPLQFEFSLRVRQSLTSNVVDFRSYDEIDAVSSTSRPRRSSSHQITPTARFFNQAALRVVARRGHRSDHDAGDANDPAPGNQHDLHAEPLHAHSSARGGVLARGPHSNDWACSARDSLGSLQFGVLPRDLLAC